MTKPPMSYELLEKHDGLIMHIAKPHLPQLYDMGIYQDEILQAGRFAIIRIYGAWDPDKGAFSGYFWNYIRAHIVNISREFRHGLQIPSAAHAIYRLFLYKQAKATEELTVTKFRNTCLHRNQEMMASSDHKIQSIMNLTKMSFYSTDTGKFIDRLNAIVDKNNTNLFEHIEDGQSASSLLKLLTTRQSDVVAWRLGLFDNTPKTFEQIGVLIGGRTKQRAEQIYSDGIKRLREALFNSAKPACEIGK